MRTVVLTLMVAVGLLFACAGGEQCIEHSTAYYHQGLAKLLTAKGVTNSVQKNRGVCFSKRDESKVKATQQELERYFFEVAGLLRDSCEEVAVVEWATREQLPFEVHDTTSSTGSRGRMINIYSFSSEEVVANRRKLSSEAPRSVTCDAKGAK